MDMDEYEKLRAAERERVYDELLKWEADKERKLRRTRWAAGTASLVGALVSLVATFGMKTVEGLGSAPASTTDVKAVQAQLAAAHKTLADALARADSVAANVVETSKKQQEEIAVLRARYESLKALTAGQEELARSYRAILTERTWTQWFLDTVFGFSLGILSSLVASWMWARFYKRPQRDQQAKA